MTLADVLKSVEESPAGYVRIARQIEARDWEELHPLRIGFLASFTAEILRPYLIVECARRVIHAKPYFAPFNQLEQEVLDPSSGLYAAQPELVVLATRLEDTAPRLTDQFLRLSPSEIDNDLSDLQARMQGLIEAIRRRSSCTILVFNFGPPVNIAAGMADAALPHSQISIAPRVNDQLSALCRSTPDVHVFDYARLINEFGLFNWFDPKLWFTGRIPMSALAQRETARRLARYIRAAVQPACKCLVVDLDNTLWGGVIGEDGLGGIALGEDYPGNLFKDIQRYLLSLRDRGMLLAVASKNNSDDALEVFRQHPDCLIKEDDFSALQIHWMDKAKSLVAIAGELNIGVDALAYLDDNPVERDWIRTKLPEVKVIEVPENPIGFIKAIEDSGTFDHLAISTEDLQRAEMYRQDYQRKKLQRQIESLDDFLRELDMNVRIGSVDSESLPRVAQLLGKTNQFNTTTRRYSASEVQALVDGGAIALWLRASDRFGEHGLVGVAIALPQQEGRWIIDVFLQSCRVIGRRIETALLHWLSAMVRERGGTVLLGEFIPSIKNHPARDLYARHGFKPLDADGHLWAWDLTAGPIECPVSMSVRFEDGHR